MGEGKLWERIFRGGKREGSDSTATTEVKEISVEDDLKLLEDRLNDPDGVSEGVALEALDRLLLVAESNPQVGSQMDVYVGVYKEHQESEEEPEYTKNSEIYEKIFEWSEKKRLGKFYYDRENPKRELGK